NSMADLLSGQFERRDGWLCAPTRLLTPHPLEREMRIRTQLVSGFGLLLVLMIAVAVLAVLRVGLINSTLTEIVDVNTVKQRQAINFRGSVHDRAIAFRDLVLLDNMGELQRTLTTIQNLTAQYAEAAERLDAIYAAEQAGNAEERQL